MRIRTNLVNISDLGYKNLYDYIEELFISQIFNYCVEHNEAVSGSYVMRAKIGYDKNDLDSITCVLSWDDYIEFEWDIDEGQKWIEINEIQDVETLMDFWIDKKEK